MIHADLVLIPSFSFFLALLRGSLVLHTDVVDDFGEVCAVFGLHLHIDLGVADLVAQVGYILKKMTIFMKCTRIWLLYKYADMTGYVCLLASQIK